MTTQLFILWSSPGKITLLHERHTSTTHNGLIFQNGIRKQRQTLSLQKNMCLCGNHSELLSIIWLYPYEFIMANNDEPSILLLQQSSPTFDPWCNIFPLVFLQSLICQRQLLCIWSKWSVFKTRAVNYHNVWFGGLFCASLQVLYWKLYKNYILAISMGS